MKSKKKFVRLLYISTLLIIIAIIVTYAASFYIHQTFESPPVVKDLLWEFLPYFPILWLSEIFLVLSVACLFIFAIRNDKFSIPYAITLYSVFHILRAGLIILTPLGFPNEYGGFMQSGSKSVFMFGAFPSGHLSIPYLTFMITKSKIALILTILVGATLLLSESHYSIDLIGTLLLAYPLFKFSEKYLRKYFKDVTK